MVDNFVPVDQIGEPEQFAAHLRMALGEGYQVTAPRNFAHGKNSSFFTVVCPNANIADDLLGVMKELGATPFIAHRVSATGTTFHIPNIKAARKIAARLAGSIHEFTAKWPQATSQQATQPKAVQKVTKTPTKETSHPEKAYSLLYRTRPNYSPRISVKQALKGISPEEVTQIRSAIVEHLQDEFENGNNSRRFLLHLYDFIGWPGLDKESVVQGLVADSLTLFLNENANRDSPASFLEPVFRHKQMGYLSRVDEETRVQVVARIIQNLSGYPANEEDKAFHTLLGSWLSGKAADRAVRTGLNRAHVSHLEQLQSEGLRSLAWVILCTMCSRFFFSNPTILFGTPILLPSVFRHFWPTPKSTA